MMNSVLLGSAVRCADTREGLHPFPPRVQSVVLDPETTKLAYLVVHHGLVAGHDVCVPVEDLVTIGPSEVILAINTDELKTLPDLEVVAPGRSYSQRSIPESFLVLDNGLPIVDSTGRTLAHFNGLVIGEQHQATHILPSSTTVAPIPIEDVEACSEQRIQIQTPEAL